MSEPTIKVKRLAYVRVEAPDLDEAERFLTEFGLRVAAREGEVVYLRGMDTAPPCYVLSPGDGGATGLAFEADSRGDLERLARVEGASAIEKLDDPAGGEVVRLRDPQGMRVEVVHGRAALEPLPAPPPHEYNMNGRRHREGELAAIDHGPSHVRRLGHLVLESADPRSVYAWYHALLGLRKADEVKRPDGGTLMLFACLDRGPEFVDHHVVGFQFAMDEGARVQHVAFEVDNFDDLMAGHEHLSSKKRKSVWGVGRHRFGGQIFDYWASPFGLIHEHWTDTDLVNEENVATDCAVGDLREYWGPRPSAAFIVSRWNWKAVRNVASMLAMRLRGAA